MVMNYRIIVVYVSEMVHHALDILHRVWSVRDQHDVARHIRSGAEADDPPRPASSFNYQRMIYLAVH